jgi:hypothetical protein
MSLEPINYDPIQNIFCNYLKSADIDDEERSSYILACDEGILKLKDILNINVDDNTYLSDNFDLIDNIRYKVDRGGNPTTEILDIYKRYLTPIFTSNLKEGTDSRFRLVNGLTSQDVKRLNYYDRYIITFAVTTKFIALHNKQILMNEMKELLRFTVIKLYNCYNRINVSKKITSDLKGGALYLSTDEEMKKIEGQIIVLYNLYITNCLSVEDLTNKYNPTPHSVVVNLSNIFVALLLSGAILGAVTAAVAMPPAGAIALGATSSAVGMCYTQHRGKLQSSYCTSADANQILKKLFSDFKLTVAQCDGCITSITNAQLKPRYDEIQTKINEFVRNVNEKYDKYNRIFNFIIDNIDSFLPPNKCDPIELPPPLNEVDEKIKGYLPVLKSFLEISTRTWGQNADFNNTMNAIIQNFPGQQCSLPTTKRELKSLINNIEIRQGADLLGNISTVLLCRDPPSNMSHFEEMRQREYSQGYDGGPSVWGGKTRKSRKNRKRKEKTQNKRSKKRKTNRRR